MLVCGTITIRNRKHQGLAIFEYTCQRKVHRILDLLRRCGYRSKLNFPTYRWGNPTRITIFGQGLPRVVRKLMGRQRKMPPQIFKNRYCLWTAVNEIICLYPTGICDPRPDVLTFLFKANDIFAHRLLRAPSPSKKKREQSHMIRWLKSNIGDFLHYNADNV